MPGTLRSGVTTLSDLTLSKTLGRVWGSLPVTTRGCYRHPMGRGQVCYFTYNAQVKSPQQSIIQPQMPTDASTQADIKHLTWIPHSYSNNPRNSIEFLGGLALDPPTNPVNWPSRFPPWNTVRGDRDAPNVKCGRWLGRLCTRASSLQPGFPSCFCYWVFWFSYYCNYII